MTPRKSPALGEFWTPSLGFLIFWIGCAALLIGAAAALVQGMYLAAAISVGAIVALRMSIEGLVALVQIHDMLAQFRDQRQIETRARQAQAQESARRARINPAPSENRIEPM